LFAKLRKALAVKDGALARKLVAGAEAVKKWAKGKLTVTADEQVLYDGKPVDPKMHARVLDMVGKKVPVTVLLRFLDNLHQNPNAEAIADLLEFLEYMDLPLTYDGCFLAFKKVGRDFRDMHTRSTDCSVGNIVTMKRSQCNPSRHETCSTGLHFARYSYFKAENYSSSEHCILVKINPRDVTAIPKEYHNAKGRCCQYEVLAEVKNEKEMQDLFARFKTIRIKDILKTTGTEQKEAVNVVVVHQKGTCRESVKARTVKTTRTAIKKAAKKSAKKVTKQAVKKAVKKSAKKVIKSKVVKRR
jgi:hypothetical protein